MHETTSPTTQKTGKNLQTNYKFTYHILPDCKSAYLRLSTWSATNLPPIKSDNNQLCPNTPPSASTASGITNAKTCAPWAHCISVLMKPENASSLLGNNSTIVLSQKVWTLMRLHIYKGFYNEEKKTVTNQKKNFFLNNSALSKELFHLVYCPIGMWRNW